VASVHGSYDLGNPIRPMQISLITFRLKMHGPMRCRTRRDTRADEVRWLVGDFDFLINNIKSYGGRESSVSSSWDKSGEGSWSCFSSKSIVSDVRSPRPHVLIGDVAEGTAQHRLKFILIKMDSFCPPFCLTHLQAQILQLFSH
jgi:hypothetical protein